MTLNTHTHANTHTHTHKQCRNLSKPKCDLSIGHGASCFINCCSHLKYRYKYWEAYNCSYCRVYVNSIKIFPNIILGYMPHSSYHHGAYNDFFSIFSTLLACKYTQHKQTLAHTKQDIHTYYILQTDISSDFSIPFPLLITYPITSYSCTHQTCLVYKTSFISNESQMTVIWGSSQGDIM